jgi:cystathionine gamma-synthase
VTDASWHRTTRAVVAGRPDPTPDAPLSVPVVATSTFAAGGHIGYGRYGNPTWEAFEQAMGSLEGGRSVAFASGMAAVSATAAVLLAGRHPGGAVVVPSDGYHTAVDLLGRLGRPVRSVPVQDTQAVLDALPGAALLWVESPSNPLLQVADLPAVVAAAGRAGAAVAVDATAATPLLLRPLEHGADVVVHAATKYVAGHSDVLMGVASAATPALAEQLHAHRTLHGAVPGPFEVWLALRGLRTLPVRLDRAQHSAMELARRLHRHPAVSRVRYPGLPGDPGYDRARRTMDGAGALVSIEVHGGAAHADAVTARTRLWVNATSFGGVESLLERRRRWASERLSVPESLIRLSVGLEDVDDLWRDLDDALTQA